MLASKVQSVKPRVMPTISVVSPLLQPRATMATLKELQMRLKSITNIAKITKSMKMIATTKVTRAQRNMEAARFFERSAKAVTKHAETKLPEGKVDLFVAFSSDRGLCGGVHSAVSKMVRRTLKEQKNEGSVVVLGDKVRTQLAREYKENLSVNFNQIGKTVPTFYEASLVSDLIFKEKAYSSTAHVALVYNQFKSTIAYEVQLHPLPPPASFLTSPKLSTYEATTEALQHFQEFLFAAEVFWAMSEAHASEMSSRRSAMDNATKNAGEIIDNLKMRYNRQRQASITNELVDIITGASAV